MKKYIKGFTLIELLVVIAIIGILSSIVLVSLNSARSKGSDARIQTELNQIRSQMETDYTGSAYLGVCASATGCYDVTTAAGLATNGVATQFAANSNYATVAADIYSQSGNNGVRITYTNGLTKFAAYAQTKSTAGKYYCVDSSGNVKPGTSNGPTGTLNATNGGTTPGICE